MILIMNTCIDNLTRQSVQKTAYNSKHQIKTLLIVDGIYVGVESCNNHN